MSSAGKANGEHANAHPAPTPRRSLSSSGSTSSLSELSVTEAELSALRDAAANGDLEDHLSLINTLRGTADLSALRSARESCVQKYLLPEPHWRLWLSDEAALADSLTTRSALSELYIRALQHYPTPCLHAARVAHEIVRFRNADISPDLLRACLSDAVMVGAPYHDSFDSVTRELEASDLSHVLSTDLRADKGLRPLKDDGLAVFETRITDTPRGDDGKPGLSSDDRVATYLSYAAYAETISPLCAVSVYERAVAEGFRRSELWLRYAAFLKVAYGNDSSQRRTVLERACKAIPHELIVWRLVVATVSSDSLPAVLERVRPFVMKSSDLFGAAQLTKVAWSRFLQLGCPASARDCVHTSLDFNIPDTVEWASACAHAAAVLAAIQDWSGVARTMDAVVASRSEARWWLAYSHLTHGNDATQAVFSRALRAVGTVSDVHVIADAWEAFEVSQGGDGLTERIEQIRTIAEKRRSERMTRMQDQKAEGQKTQGRRESRSGRRLGGSQKRQKRDGMSSVKGPIEVADTGEKKALKSDKEEHAEEAMERTESKRTTEGQEDKMEDVAPGGRATEKLKQKEKQTDASNAHGKEVEPKTIFVSNLAFGVTEEDLRNAFDSFGGIEQIRVPKRSDGATKGIAYIEFADEVSVSNALAMHNTPIKGRTAWVQRSKPPARKPRISHQSRAGNVTRQRGRRGRDGSGGRGGRGGREGRRRPHMRVDLDKDVEMGEEEAESGNRSGLKQDDFRALLSGGGSGAKEGANANEK